MIQAATGAPQDDPHYLLETVVSSVLAVVLLVLLVLFVVRMRRHGETDVRVDYLLGGTPEQASATVLHSLDGLKGLQLRPRTPYEIELVRMRTPGWASAFLVLGPLAAIVGGLATREEHVTRAVLCPGPSNQPMLRLDGRLTKPQLASVVDALAPVGTRL